MPRPRILYLALADARGHLMRAHLLARALADEVDVEVVTTAHRGASFLGQMGTSAAVLSEHFRVEFNARHDMSRARTDRRVMNYLALPWRGLADFGRLAALARGARLVVNDSLHPALLAAPLAGFPAPVVQVYGENLWRALEDNFQRRAPAWLERHYRRMLRAARDASFGRVIHVLGAPAETPGQPRTYRLPPIVARPTHTRAEVRARLGVPADARLAAVYLNPHFGERSIADGLEGALRAEGFHLHAVGEGYPGRPGWRATDAAFADVVHAADLFVSGAGMGALELARASGTPLLVLLGDQPEQERNVADAARRLPGLRFRAVALGTPLAPAVAEATQGLLRSEPPLGQTGRGAPATDTEALWRTALLELVHQAETRARATAGRLVLRPGLE